MPSITFNGSSDILTSNTRLVTSGNARTVILLVKSSNAANYEALSFCNAASYGILYGTFSATSVTTSDDASFRNNGTYTPDTNAHSVASTYTLGTVSPYYIDNVLISQTVGETVSPNDNGTTNFQIGGGALGFFQGQIDEVIVYSRILNSTELGQVHTYQQSFWGIA
jgi:hypothetical protein